MLNLCSSNTVPEQIITSNNHPLFFDHKAQEENTPMFLGANSTNP
jgi:hypothetical protein